MGLWPQACPLSLPCHERQHHSLKVHRKATANLGSNLCLSTDYTCDPWHHLTSLLLHWLTSVPGDSATG